MDIDSEIRDLQQYLDRLAQHEDGEFQQRYSMRRPGRPPGLYWQLRWLAGRCVRWLESIGLLPTHPWPVSLVHSGKDRGARPVLVWAVGADQESLRKTTTGLSRLFDDLPGFAPVLVTDVADFAFFSRLGWLVEYLPAISGEGERFEDRKSRFLARLYRGAPAIPARAGLTTGPQLENLRRWLTGSTSPS